MDNVVRIGAIAVAVGAIALAVKKECGSSADDMDVLPANFEQRVREIVGGSEMVADTDITDVGMTIGEYCAQFDLKLGGYSDFCEE